MRHAAVGALIIAVALWAFIAVTAVFRSNLKAPWLVAVIGGLLVAAVIFCIDLLITSTPLTKDNAFYRARIVLIRGAISLAMGLVIAHATILFMYSDTLNQIVSAKNHITAQADTKRIRDQSQWPPAIGAAQSQITADRNQIQATDSSLASAQAELDRSRKAWLNDQLCVRGSLATDGELCGTGPVSEALRSSYQELNSNFPALRSADGKTVSSLDSAITNLNSTISADRNRLSAQIHAGIAADLANTGLAAQSEALWTLLKQDVLLWLWPVFFIVIDLAVALMKGVLPESDFDRSRRRDHQQDDLLNDAVKNLPIDQQAVSDIADLRRNVVMARARAAAGRQIEAIQSRQMRSSSRPRDRLAWLGFSITAAVTLAFTLVSLRG